MINIGYVETGGYFIGDPEMNIYYDKGRKINLGEFREGIYQTKQGDTFVVSEKGKIVIQEFKSGMLEKRNLKYLRLVGKVIEGDGEIKMVGVGKGARVLYGNLIGEVEEVFSELKKVH